MVIIMYESYDSVLVETGKQKGLESLSENHEKPENLPLYVASATWRGRSFQTVAPETGNDH